MSIRSTASVCQLVQVSSVPRGARTGRGPDAIVMLSVSSSGSTDSLPRAPDRVSDPVSPAIRIQK